MRTLPKESVALACLALAALLLAPGPARAAYTFDKPQAKINWIDVSEAPIVKIYVSFLDRRLRPVPLKEVRTIEVNRHEDEGGRGEKVKSFVDMLPEDGGDGEVILFSKAGDARDYVLVAAGHQDPEMRDGDLGTNQRESLGIFFKKITSGRLNLIWYSDRLLTYVDRSGKQGDLSDLADSLDFCREKALESYEYWGMAPPDPEEGEEAAGDPCGLLEDFGKLEKILKDEPYRGFFPRLLGIESIEGCIKPRHERIGKGGPEGGGGGEEVYGGAIDEAFRMLLQKGSIQKPKYLIVLSDGKDGYLDDAEDCRLKYLYDAKKDLEKLRDSCREQTRGSRAFRDCLRDSDYAKKSRQVKAKAEGELLKRAVAMQQRFRDERLGRWLALADAGKVVVHAVGYPTGTPSERERLEILAMKTGGTYREVTEAAALGDAYSDLVDELSNQYVILFDAGVKAKETATFSVKLSVGGAGSFKTAAFSVYVPEVISGFAALKRMGMEKFHWLENKVGSPWHIVIVVVAAILALLLLFLLFKMIIGLIKKIFGKGAKKAAGLAKKGAGGMPKVPSGLIRK